MVDQTHMKPRNGLLKEVSHSLRDDIGGFAHDVLTLTELQSKLFVTEVQEQGRRSVLPTTVLFLGIMVGMACGPIALVAFALMLMQSMELSYASAFAITAIAGATLSSLISITGWKLFRSRVSLPSRSREELARNLKWMKNALSKGAGSSNVLYPKERKPPTSFSDESDPF
jgi:uncharacterized membrane protein YqjE